MASGAQEVLDFWFGELDPQQWFARDYGLDRRITERFGDLHARAAQCELFGWRDSARGRLAEVIVLDQFSRNIHRDRPGAFACDAIALALAQEAVSQGIDVVLGPAEKSFLYMPYMHSESPLIHDVAMTLYSQEGLEYNLRFEKAHKEIIDRFGRYPHRNAILGRESTPAERAFLEQPGSSF